MQLSPLKEQSWETSDLEVRDLPAISVALDELLLEQ